MIKVELIKFKDKNRNPYCSFLVKNKKKIEFWKSLENKETGYFSEVRIHEYR